MIQSVLVNLVVKQVKKNLKIKNPTKVLFNLDYLKDRLSTEAINDDNKIHQAEPLILSDNSELALVLSGQLKKKIKFKEIHFITSIWDLKGKTMENAVYFIDESGQKRNYKETVKI